MNSEPSPAPPRHDPWRAHLGELLRELGIPPGLQSDHLQAGVAAYCAQHHPRGLQSTDLKLLTARAFCSIGDRASAGRVIEAMEPHRRHTERWLEILTELHHFPTLLPLFSRGVIRPADWAGAQLDRMWMLDFGRLVLNDAERHEMMLYRSVRTLTERMAAFWDATGGEGVLGLKSLTVLYIDADRRNTQDAVTSPEEMIRYIGDLFKRQKALRGWQDVPILLTLDL